MSFRPPPRGQERGIPIVSSAVVQSPLSGAVFPGSYPPAPQLVSRYPPNYGQQNYAHPLTTFPEDARRPVTSQSSYPRLPQRLHHPILPTQQALLSQRQQPELQLNLQEAVGSGVMPGDVTGTTIGRSPVPVVKRHPPIPPVLQPPIGFTPDQLTVLRQQILVFRRMKKGDYAIEQKVLDQTKPLPLSHPTNRNEEANGSLVTKDVSLFRLDHGHEGTLALRMSAGILLRGEYKQRVTQRLTEEIWKIEQALKGPTQPGFPPRGCRGSSSSIPYRGELMTRLRKLKLWFVQKNMRREVEENQMEVMKLNDRTYRRFVRDCNRTRFEMFKAGEKAKSDRAQERAQAAKRMKMSLFDRASTFRDFRTLHNKGVLRIHERQARTHHKQKDDDQQRRMEALKANDFEAYQELLLQQQQSSTGPKDAGDRYEEISRFLTGTEEYLNRLAAKVASVKISQEASEAAAKAISEARAQGLTEEEVQIAAREAAQEVASTTELTKRSLNFGEDAQSRYYSLAHSVDEEIRREPSYLNPPTGAFLRPYQIVGLQWMVSLYNNRLNGILADEMGLGKTVQVMALIAYLMEHKSDYGPHLIIVPNAVMVNWKAEFMQWLPNLRVVYYVGQKEERSKKYHQEVQAMQFNVLVTTYEFIMRDRAKLCRVQWHYIVIDEAQRMKDRQSKLAQDLNRFSAMRRLLLTGTPLQNDLQELWSLLNLLLPEVFDDRKGFTEWFGEALGGTGAAADDKTRQDQTEWLEKEKRVVVIHRLHQILEPFMLRRQVQDVERKLPNKIPVVLKVAMTPYQSRVYNWVKATGTLRLDPEGPMYGQRRHPFAPLNNKVMELRKVCNHPLLSYAHQEYTLESLVRQCGKLSLLDRILIKLYKAGHRVLLFSTMTKLLDLMEIYMKWRRMDDGKMFNYRRIDGGTSLEEREVAIRDFNQPGSDVFLFLLSIRAAGRGLNLQTADTVIIFDPDANPKNEEQAVARAYRIGQTKDVLVIYLESVADPLNYEAPVDTGVSTGKMYVDSIESLVRKTIQKQKIEMANEVIDAGRFDMNTTNAQRRQTLENLLADEERFKVATNQVPELKEINQLIARSAQEVDLFHALDESECWPYDPLLECPEWMFFDDDDIMEALKTTSRHHIKRELKKREDAGWTPVRKQMKRMETSGSLMDVESKDQSSSLGAEVMDGRIMEDDEVEEIFTAENISVDEADFKDEGARFKGPTGAEVPQKPRSRQDRQRRLDMSVFYQAPCLRYQEKDSRSGLKIRIKGLKRS